MDRTLLLRAKFSRVFVLCCASISLAILSGCAPTKGYAGPELPDTQISLVTLSYDSDSVSTGTTTIDAFDFGSSGIKVLPGKHDFSLAATLKDPPHFCQAYPEMDSYGYNKCLKKNDYCDCFAYLTVQNRCTRTTYSAQCSGAITTKAGKKYTIQVIKVGQEGRVSASEEGHYSPVGKGSCSVGGSGEEETTEQVGSGRSDAYKYGITWCG